MHRVLILGAGKIGSLVAVLLSSSKDYQVYLGDIHTNTSVIKKANKSSPEVVTLDANDPKKIADFIRANKIQVVISSLPFYCGGDIAKLAKECGIHYFDLTEDVKTTHLVRELAQDGASIFVPQCGLAPGFISIVANHLMQHFQQLDTVKMRVGALPINVSNALQYSLTWSTDGLINEYGNLCQALENGEEVNLPPMDGLEEIKIDGLTYEAFNTSGGIGSLVQTYSGKVKHLNYKTIRYPGHCEKMAFLMNDLQLNDDRETLKRILEKALPKTVQDVVLVYVSVTGTQENQLSEESYVKKFYSQKINGSFWSAIQLTTASSLCAVLDIVMNNLGKYKGLVRQEQFTLEEFTSNRFGKYYN
jgi:saccharopine dehydrogenase-like NADP-dependent oxidoreductase